MAESDSEECRSACNSVETDEECYCRGVENCKGFSYPNIMTIDSPCCYVLTSNKACSAPSEYGFTVHACFAKHPSEEGRYTISDVGIEVIDEEEDIHLSLNKSRTVSTDITSTTTFNETFTHYTSQKFTMRYILYSEAPENRFRSDYVIVSIYPSIISFIIRAFSSLWT